MQRISQFFKKLFPSTPKGDLIPQPTKREVILTEKAARPKSKYFKIRRKHALAHEKTMKLKAKNGGLPVVSFGNFSRIKLLIGQKTGMEKFRERERAS